MSKWQRRIRQVVVVIGITVAMVLVVGELGLRIVGYEAPPFWRQDPRFGWSLRPNLAARYRDEGDAWVTTNSVGLRDVEHSISKPPGTFRITVLGDSFSEAIQVDRAKTYWAQLDRELESCPYRKDRKVEVINFGVSSYGTANELLRLEQEAFAYAPDLVLTEFCSNDLQDNHPKLDHLSVKTRPYFTLQGDGLALRVGEPLSGYRAFWQSVLPISRLAQLVERVRKNRARAAANIPADEVAGVPAEFFQTALPPVWEESWMVTERLLRRMKDESEAHEARFLLAAIAPGSAIVPDDAARARFAAKIGASDMFAVETRLTGLSRRQGIDLVALGAPMLERARQTNTCLYGFANALPCEGHWNEAGHRAAGEIIAAKICALWGTEQAVAK